MSQLRTIPESPGIFIVFEGADRVGKSTQARRLAEALGAELLRFPDYDLPGGELLRDYLLGKVELAAEAAHLMFSANRWQMARRIVGLLEQGKTVVCDRYAYSGVAYSVAKGLSTKWCKYADTGLPVPDVVFHLTASVAETRQRAGFGQNDRHETEELQRAIKSVYELELVGCDTLWIDISGGSSVVEVAQIIHNEVRMLQTQPTKRRVLNHSGLFERDINTRKTSV